MQGSQNKLKVFVDVAKKIVESCEGNLIIVTKGESILSNGVACMRNLSPCNHKEKYTRIFCHIFHAISDQNMKPLATKAFFTDVLVLAVNVFETL